MLAKKITEEIRTKELSLDFIFSSNETIDYSLSNIFQILVYSRVLNPCSKKSSFESMDNYFLNFDFGINDVYSFKFYNKPH